MDAIDNKAAFIYDSIATTVTQEYSMFLSLSPELERQITERIESGEYESADEVVRHALQALSREDEDYATRLEALRSELQKGIDSLNQGLHSPKDEVFARLRARRGRTAA